MDHKGPITWANGNWRITLPEEFRVEANQRSNEYREITPLDEWVSTIITSYPNGYIKGQALFEAARQQFKCLPQDFAKAMRAAGWTKKRPKVDGMSINCWVHTSSTGSIPADYTASLI